MSRLMIFIFLLLLTNVCFGTFDVLNPDISAVGARELHDGQWLAGIQKGLWHLDAFGREAFHVNGIVLWNAERGNHMFGLSVGIPIGTSGDYIGNALRNSAPGIYESIKWIPKVADFVSMDIFAGYRFFHTPDVHSFGYGIMGMVKIPLDLVKGL